jgi:hypothetical protein
MSSCTTFHCLNGRVHPVTIAASKDAGVKALRIARGFPRWTAAHSVGKADVLAQILENAVICFVQVVAQDPNRVTAWWVNFDVCFIMFLVRTRRREMALIFVL